MFLDPKKFPTNNIQIVITNNHNIVLVFFSCNIFLTFRTPTPNLTVTTSKNHFKVPKIDDLYLSYTLYTWIIKTSQNQLK